MCLKRVTCTRPLYVTLVCYAADAVCSLSAQSDFMCHDVHVSGGAGIPMSCPGPFSWRLCELASLKGWRNSMAPHGVAVTSLSGCQGTTQT